MARAVALFGQIFVKSTPNSTGQSASLPLNSEPLKVQLEHTDLVNPSLPSIFVSDRREVTGNRHSPASEPNTTLIHCVSSYAMDIFTRRRRPEDTLNNL